MSAVTGIDRIRALREKLLRTKGCAREVAQVAAPLLSLQTQADFMARRTPTGEAWPPYAQKHGLIRSGTLRGRIGFRWDGSTWVRTRSFPRYAKYQNPRLFIVARSLPGPYRDAIERAFLSWIRKVGLAS